MSFDIAGAERLFRVTADTIESKGQTWKKADIHRLLIKNGITKSIATAPGA